MTFPLNTIRKNQELLSHLLIELRLLENPELIGRRNG